jgi:hypothetical protein
LRKPLSQSSGFWNSDDRTKSQKRLFELGEIAEWACLDIASKGGPHNGKHLIRLPRSRNLLALDGGARTSSRRTGGVLGGAFVAPVRTADPSRGDHVNSPCGKQSLR